MDPLQIVVIGGVAGVLVLVAYLGRKQRRATFEVWQRLATQHGGELLDAEEEGLKVHSPSLSLRSGQIGVLVDSYVVSMGEHATTYTRARARFAIGAGPSFRVTPAGLLTELGKALGTQDVVLGGDELFDEQYVVKCDDEEAVRLTWTPRARQLMRALEGNQAESDGETLSVRVSGLIADPARLELLWTLAGELASLGARALPDLAERDDARFVPTAGPWDAPSPPYVSVETAGGEVRVRVLPSRGRPKLQLSIAHAREVPPFSVDVAGGRPLGELPRGLLGERAASQLLRIGAGTLKGSTEAMQLVLPLEASPEAVDGGLALLSEVARGARADGAFR